MSSQEAGKASKQEGGNAVRAKLPYFVPMYVRLLSMVSLMQSIVPAPVIDAFAAEHLGCPLQHKITRR